MTGEEERRNREERGLGDNMGSHPVGGARYVPSE